MAPKIAIVFVSPPTTPTPHLQDTLEATAAQSRGLIDLINLVFDVRPHPEDRRGREKGH